MSVASDRRRLARRAGAGLADAELASSCAGDGLRAARPQASRESRERADEVASHARANDAQGAAACRAHNRRRDAGSRTPAAVSTRTSQPDAASAFASRQTILPPISSEGGKCQVTMTMRRAFPGMPRSSLVGGAAAEGRAPRNCPARAAQILADARLRSPLRDLPGSCHTRSNAGRNSHRAPANFTGPLQTAKGSVPLHGPDRAPEPSSSANARSYPVH